MKTKKYLDVFAEARKHPQYETYLKEADARIKLAATLYKARSTRSLSMKDLAKKAGTTPAVISRIENAQVSAGIDLIYKIFQALGEDQFLITIEKISPSRKEL